MQLNNYFLMGVPLLEARPFSRIVKISLTADHFIFCGLAEHPYSFPLEVSPG